MKVVPVAHQREDEEHEGDQQQTARFRCVHSMASMRVGISLALCAVVWETAWSRHGPIVALATNRKLGRNRTCNLPMLHYVVVSSDKARITRFGVFELDLGAGELRKNGLKLRLQGQPIQVLTLLLEHAGEVVTRDELRQKLWPSDTFVDFDHSVNTAINKVREALGDSASSPRYVETLARRGYRFIAPVDYGAPNHPAPVESSAASAQPSGAVALHPELDVPMPRRGLTRALFALIQSMYLIFYVTALVRLHAIQVIADSFLPPRRASTMAGLVMVTAGVGIPLRCYLISAVGFDYRRLGEKFRRMFPLVLALDELWAIAPFLLIEKIGIGGAFAASAALLYLPFSERTLLRMAYVDRRDS